MPSIPEREYYNLAAQLQYQQRRIAELEAENSELKRRLNDLRRGVGITVTVQGQTMTLTSPVITVVNQSNEPVDPGITGIFPHMRTDPAMEPPPPARGATGATPSPEHEADMTGRSWGARPFSQRGPSSPPPMSRPPQYEARDWPTLTHGSERRSRSVPSVPRRGQAPSPASPQVQEAFSTLAKLTGHQPTVHQQEQPRRYPSTPSDFSDSFVLG